VSYEIVYSRQAQKDAKKLAKSNLKAQAEELLTILKEDPFRSPPRWEALRGDLKGCYSRRINIQHRLVYEVFEDKKIVHVLIMWTHYDD
jgi:toxin YoeB